MNPTLSILLIYLIGLFIVAWFFSRNESLEGYFINKRNTGLWFLTFSTVATVVGAGATVGIVSEVYNSGISYGLALPVSFIVGMVITGIVAQKIRRIGEQYNIQTIVDFFEKRFDTKNKALAAVLQTFLLIIWTSVQAIAIASLATVIGGVSYELALLLTAGITILYTAVGGLKIDIITDVIQFWIIAVVFVVLAVIGYRHVGGITEMVSQLPQGHLDPFAFGGISWFIGVILLSGFVYLGNGAHWQRILSAKNEHIARSSFFWSIPFVALLAFLTVFISLVATVTLPNIEQDTAVFAIMHELLPTGLVGVGFAALLAVIMSSLDSLLIGGSTIIYNALRRYNNTYSRPLLKARLITGLFGSIGFLIAFLIPNIITLSLVVLYLALIFVPPLLAGIYSKTRSGSASFYALLIPTIALMALFPIMKENTFIITTPLGILIILFYDKIIRRPIKVNQQHSFSTSQEKTQE